MNIDPETLKEIIEAWRDGCGTCGECDTCIYGGEGERACNEAVKAIQELIEKVAEWQERAERVLRMDNYNRGIYLRQLANQIRDSGKGGRR